MNARLIVRGSNRGKGIRYLACDPQATEGQLTYTIDRTNAYVFELYELPQLLDLVRRKSQGFAVILITHNSECSLSERNRREL